MVVIFEISAPLFGPLQLLLVLNCFCLFTLIAFLISKDAFKAWNFLKSEWFDKGPLRGIRFSTTIALIILTTFSLFYNNLASCE